MSKVQVAVRCRPKLPHEQNVPANKIECNEVSNTISVTGATTAGTQGGTTKTFSFDKVIPENATQEDIFDYVSPMVDHALDGLHSTVFAYGQTGSGKTFTMEGYDYAPTHNNKLQPKEDTPPAQHGIVPRLIQLAFDRARERMGGRATADEADEFGPDGNDDEDGTTQDSDIRYKLKCSFVQLYNERVTDLLNPTSNARNKEGLRLRWTRNDQFVVENLFTFECDNATQMRDMFLTGVKEKVMGSHHMNVQSSRSHCLFTIHVHSWNTHNPELVRKAELTLVDLAGSEKLALLSHNPSAQLLKESIEINTSLLALGKVITALAARSTGKAGSKANSTHIPYRDSKLTKLLKHALGGNSMTIMIACINPLDPYVEESVSTLLYAGRARNITNEPTVNDDPRSALIRSLRDEITTLKTELEYYRQLVVNGVVDDKLAAQLTEKLEKANRDTKQQRAIFGPSTDGGDDGGDAQSTKEVELAEKLIESCKILKNLMGVNGQLREAFDKLKVSKEKLEQREVSVNAENTALRERIEMLESIALQEGSANDSDASDDDDNHGATSNKKASSFTRKRSDKSVTSTTAASSGKEASNHKSAAGASSDVSRPQQPAPPTSRPQSSSGRSSPPPPEVMTTQANAPRRSDTGSNNTGAPPPPVAPRRSTSTRSDKASSAKQPQPKRKAAAANGGGGKGLGFYQNQLQAYANKYRNPTKAASYEDYYGRSSVKNPIGGTGGRYDNNPSRQMETTNSSNPNAQQLAITKKSQEVAALLNKLSKNLPESTVALIPSSLQGEHNFGSLGFGGTGTERDELEEKRRLREERLRQLREQNQSLGTKSYFDGPMSGGGGGGGMASSAGGGGGGGSGYGSGGGGSGLNLANTYSGAHDEALTHHNYQSTYQQQPQQQQQQQPPTFGGLSPNPQRGRRATQPTQSSVVASTSSVGSATGKLFQYLSQEETETAFSAEQLEKLKRRSGGGAASGSGVGNSGSGGTFPRSSSTDPMPVGSRPVSATITPRNNSAPNSPAPAASFSSSTPQHPKKQHHHALGSNRIGGGVPQPISMIPSAYASTGSKVGGGGTHGSSSSVVSNSPMSQASSNGGGSGTRGRRGNGPHVVAGAASSSSSTYQRDPTKGTPNYSSPSTTTPAGPTYIARLSEAVGLSTLAPSGGNLLTPRTKSSYDMGVYVNNTPPGAGGRAPSLQANNQQQQQPPPRVAAHDAMRRRGEEISEQQRYQQQMYEAQKALMDQQSKMNPRR